MKLYRYTGTGRYNGVPSRDITDDEYAGLTPRAQRIIDRSGDWTAETVRQDSPEAQKARKAAGPTGPETDQPAGPPAEKED